MNINKVLIFKNLLILYLLALGESFKLSLIDSFYCYIFHIYTNFSLPFLFRWKLLGQDFRHHFLSVTQKQTSCI